MSYWGGIVITSLLIILPNLIQWLSGSLSLSSHTILRYYIQHYLLGPTLFLLLLHTILLHTTSTTTSLTLQHNLIT